MNIKRIAALFLVGIVVSGNVAAAEPATITPSTPYAQQFLELCDGQQWFIDEVERLLNMKQSTIADIESPTDLAIIKSLGLKDKGIKGRIPRAIGELKQLRYLFLSGNKIADPIPQELYALPLLENIDLGGNEISGAVPDGFGQMQSLKILSLRDNQFAGSIPDTVLANTQISFLDVSSNQLSGGLPAALNQMTALQYLAVSNNPWGGALPDLSALASLKSLSAWNCKLTGGIPDSLYTMSTMQVLDLAGNAMTGEISPAVGGLTQLQLLALGSNDLTGSIPVEVGALAKLQSLDLSDNRLEGLVPDAFSALEQAKEIHIENNRLRGLIPASLKERSDAGTAVFAQNNYMTGTDLKTLVHNERNFTDGAATEQYQLIASKSPIRISKDSTTNLYTLLQNKSLLNSSTTNKPLLPADAYEITSTSDNVKLTGDEHGLYVQALELIPLGDSITVDIRIRDNTDSNYSKTTFVVTTDELSTGGGGGGGGSSARPVPNMVTHHPYMNGYPDQTFRAANSITREEVAKMLIVALQETTAESSYTSYRDVAATRWSAPYIDRARKLGYLLGDTDGGFRPEDNMTRAELSACLVRVADALGRETAEAKVFTDISDTAWYAEYVADATAMGLVAGYPDGTFLPDASVTRAEAVTMVNRLLQRDPRTAAALETIESPFADTSKSNWDYLDILEASVLHKH